ncbi:MAG: hypothetical protein ACP5N1_02485 [Candidatus Woesearchaeota archaeon]
MKKFSIGILFMLILVVSVTAATPVVRFVAINDTILEGDNLAVYRVVLTNVDSNDDRFQFYTISSFWDISPTIVSVPSASASTFDMEIVLNDKQLFGPQLVPITVKSLNSEDSIVENVYVYIKPSSEASLSYVPNVAMDVIIKEEIDPRNPLSIEMRMRNRNPLNITDLRVVLESELFSKEVQTTLAPLEEKTNQVLFGLNNFQEPGIYTINIKLTVQNKTIAQIKKEVRVSGYSEVSQEETKVKGLFSHANIIKLHNDGNYEVVKEVKVSKNFFEKMFTKSSEKPTILRENGISYMVWNIPLKPRESFTLNIKTNYTSLAVIIILIIAGIILYYIFRTPVLLFKRAKIITSTDEGITEIRVKLHIKNRSGREVRNVKVVDRHPKIVSLVEDNSIGSMKPTKMLSADKVHSLLMWNIEVLEPYEERLLSYTIKSNLNIIGNMHLHSAKARFLSKSGERTTNSNDVTLLHKSVNMVKYE